MNDLLFLKKVSIIAIPTVKHYKNYIIISFKHKKRSNSYCKFYTNYKQLYFIALLLKFLALINNFAIELGRFIIFEKL